MINSIQVILSAGILVITYYTYRKLRSSHLDAILILAMAATGLLFVFFPDLSNRVAHFLGVGRGADMIFYVSILFLAFLIMKLYVRTRRLEQLLAKWVRDEAIKEAQEDKEKKEDRNK
jgi:hypothetical protein